MSTSSRLKQIVADELLLSHEQLDADASFSELGIDSILAVEVVKKVNRAFGVELKSTALYDLPSIRALAEHIDGPGVEAPRGSRISLKPVGIAGPAPSSIVDAPPAEVDTPPAESAAPRTAPPPTRAQAEIRRELREVVAAGLLVSPNDLKDAAAFAEIGVDSILGVEIVKRCNQAWGTELPASILYSYPSIADLAEHVAEILAEASHAGGRSPEESNGSRSRPIVHRAVSEVRREAPPSAAPEVRREAPPSAVSEVRREAPPSTAPEVRREAPPSAAPAVRREAPPSAASEVRREEPAQAPAARAADPDEPIAVVGLSCRVPGARDAREFWVNLYQGRDSVREVPHERWDPQLWFDPDRHAPGKTYSKWGGFLDDVDKFDPLFFNISPAEASWIDPQHRLFLEECWSALEDAGYTPDDVRGRRVGVYAGIMNNDYQEVIIRSGSSPSEHGTTGIAESMLASRPSYFLNLKGPALTINTACSSSLVAIHLACESLKNRHTDMMIAGGVTCYLTESSYIGMSKLGMLSPRGVCSPFDDGADGIAPSEGVGVVVLKRLSDAIADGDRIWGIVRGSLTNQDGRTNGITAPSSISQKALFVELYERTGIHPESIQYVEAHGTGTKLGDPIEVEALSGAFRTFTQKSRFCALGSVKGNIGHTSGAAGVVSLIKVLLCMKHRTLVPSLHYERSNRHIAFEETPFTVQTEVAAWEAPQGAPRRSAISSFGFSGTNAHLIVDEPPALPIAPSTPKPAYLFAVSARTPDALRQRLAALSEALTEADGRIDLQALSYTLNRRRAHFAHRVALIASSVSELQELLEAARRGEAGPRVVLGPASAKETSASDALLFTEVLTIVIEQVRRRDGLDDATYARKLTVLGALYARGLDVDWAILHEGETSRPLSLPGYPFQRRRCWIEVSSNDSASKASPALAPSHRVSPRVQENGAHHNGARENGAYENGAGLSRGSFAAPVLEPSHGVETFELSEEQPTLADHRIAGQSIVPAVQYLELIRAALERGGKRAVRLFGCVWLDACRVRGSAPRLRLSLEEAGRFVFSSTDEAGRTVVHCRGSWEERDLARILPPVALAPLLEQAVTVLKGAEIYAKFARLGIDYGPSFRTLQWVQRAGTKLVAKIEARPSRGGELVVAGLLDGALQSLIGFAQDEGEGSSVPFSMDAVEVYGPVDSELYVVVDVKPSKGPGPSLSRQVDLKLIALDGQVRVSIENLTVRKYANKTQSIQAPTSPRVVLCEVDWRDRPAGEVPIDLAAARGVLVLEGRAGLSSALQSWCSERQHRMPIISVTPDAPFAQLGPAEYCVDPSRPEDFARLWSALAAGGIAVSHVLNLWSIHGAQRGGAGESLEDRIATGPLATFDLVAASARAGTRKLRLLHAYLTDDPLAGADAMMAGFAESVVREKPDYDLRVVGLGEACRAPSVLVDVLARDLFSKGAPRHVRWVDPRQSRFMGVRRLEADAAGTSAVAAAPVAGGVYLVTGGMGGVGRHVAHWLASEFGARLALVGRHARDPMIEAKLEPLRRAGAAAVEYFSCDVACADEVDALIPAIQDKLGALRGIIHAAGVLNDSLLVNKTRADFERVLSPKVFGAVHLHRATARHHLDFFAAFSSLAALKGNVGQVDYATANAFLGHFAAWREGQRERGECSGITVAIDWPLWRDGGMQVTAEIEQRLRDAFGLEPLETGEGMDAFRTILARGVPRVAVARGRVSAVSRYLGLEGDDVKVSTVTAGAIERGPVAAMHEPPPQRTGGDPGQREQAAVAMLTQICVATLGLDAADVDPDAPFDTLGVDSILMMKILSAIEQHVHLPVPPSMILENPTVHQLAKALVAEGFVREPSAKANGVRTEAPAPSMDPIAPSRSPAAAPVPAERAPDRRIAVIGMACRFPGSPSPESFWENLRGEKCLVTEVPPDRWDVGRSFSPDKSAGRSYSKWGGFIEGVDLFDNEFFGVADEDAVVMDPQQRIVLELTQELFDRAGYARSEIEGRNIAVLLGASQSSYINLVEGNLSDKQLAKAVVSTISNMVAARVADFYNLKGAAQTIDAACASALIAVHDACNALVDGSVDMAVAGGIGLLLDDRQFVSFSRASVLSDTGVCRVFDEKANGFVLGEGAGLVLLKRYDQAVKDGDRILGVILGSAVNNDGRTMGLTVPNQAAQEAVIELALANASVSADTISYLEAHGTGTLLGDPIEVKAASKAYSKQTEAKRYCGIGSVKSSVGHLMRAAGIASLIKVILSLQHGTIPATLHCDEPHARFQFEQSPFYPVRGTQEWRPLKGVRRAGISSFGFGGTNCHMIVEEAPRSVPAQRQERPPQPFRRRRFWADGKTPAPRHDERHLWDILSRLERGELSSEQATRMTAQAL
ncbi:SDR family NAD(P)-dependent oxidoreductase [Sorangium sp. So ce693]|uniref:SDR family NAD(P)-dependent oxidoreductase n=1 Tax=Sorangium sp. So ce693 TaxID=3133318 RepID=UPI003F63DF96